MILKDPNIDKKCFHLLGRGCPHPTFNELNIILEKSQEFLNIQE
jgi:hypothetical protein